MTPGGVVLLHGHGRFGASMTRIGRAARSAGYATFSPGYHYRRPMAEVVSDLRPRVAAFSQSVDGPLHFVTHSLGGLVARALIVSSRPERLGRMVMLGPPNGGSELADLLIRLRCDDFLLGHAAAHLRTLRAPKDEQALGSIDYDLGIIAGNRSLLPIFPRTLLPRPNDGKVTVSATRLAGTADHLVLPVTHTLMVYDGRVIRQILAFLEKGAFQRDGFVE